MRIIFTSLFSILVLNLIMLLPQTSLAAEGVGIKALKSLPIQDGGRVKPFDTFSREALELVYGKQTYKPADGKKTRPAYEIILTWILQPEAWQDTDLIEVRHNEVKKALKLADGEKHFSLNEILGNERFPLLMQELNSQRETKEKMDPYYQALQRLESQIFTFREIASGRMIKLVPPKTGDAWLGLPDLAGEQQAAFVDVTKAFVPYIAAVASESDTEAPEIQNALAEKVNAFTASAQSVNPALYANPAKIKAEVFYNGFHPFKWAWIIYLISSVCLILVWITGKNHLYKSAWALTSLGLLLHLFGFVLRVYLTERPPVSNMYETVIWVGFGAVVFSMVIEGLYRWKYILFAGSMVGFFCLALGDMAPAVLDPSLQPLEPVLRNNFWLLVHVLTITISYAAFFLAFALGDIGLVYYLLGEEKHKEKIKALVLAIYRAKQIGIAFLAPGIILGGIWADYSWGRFWGWDPKETWALIALLGYLAVLHGRMGGFIKDFGMVASAIVTFSLVIMAWYGVNFVLGAGLHSYGFGAGGVEYVSAFVAVHLLAVIFVGIVRKGRLKQNTKN